jgi:cathepsin L
MAYTIIRSRGRINPPNMEARHAMRAERHADVHAELARLAAGPLPAAYDATPYVTPIKNQGSCGSCWDFSGTCVVESANILAGKLDNTQASWLSEQYTLDQCDGANGGCGGDDNTTVLSDARIGGLPLTSVYGLYQAREGRCKMPRQIGGSLLGSVIRFFEHIGHRVPEEVKRATGTLYTLDDWGYVGPETGVADTNLIKAAMVKYGAIGCGIAADGAFESWGENNPSKANPFKGSRSPSIDHDVVLVGWDDSIGSWMLRNSWGTSWGIGGYMWISYGANQVGYESVFGVLAPVVAPPSFWSP